MISLVISEIVSYMGCSPSTSNTRYISLLARIFWELIYLLDYYLVTTIFVKQIEVNYRFDSS
jgi:hypothetical protein